MNHAMILIMALNTFVGILLSGLSVPLIRRKVKPNPWYGFRVKATLNDERIWYSANEYAGKCLFWAGLAIAGSALTLFFVPGIGFVAYSLACGGIAMVAVLVAAGCSFLFLRTIS